jgi:aryl-alcohol dehydrogenase
MEIRAALRSVIGGSFDISTLELREPGPDELLIRIAACGVCHTDISMMSSAGLMVLGHEGSGVVEAVGRDVREFATGDHVVLSYPSCGVCDACMTSQPYNCVRFSDLFMGDRLAGTRPLRFNGRVVTSFFGQGSFATHTVVHKRSAVKVDNSLDIKRLGPLGCGVQTGAGAVLNYLKPRPGRAIAVLGTGSTGLSAILAARSAGCAPIIAVDRLDSRLKLAKEFGATNCLNSEKSRDLQKEIIQLSGGIRYALDTTGSMRLMTAALACLLPGGRGCGVAAAGIPHLDSEAIALRKGWEEIIQGNAVPRVFIPSLIELYKKGRFPFDKMLTFFKFDDINEAFRQAEAAAIVKPVLTM